MTSRHRNRHPTACRQLAPRDQNWVRSAKSRRRQPPQFTILFASARLGRQTYLISLAEHQPANSTEKLLIEEMAQSWWLKQRAIGLQNTCFTPGGVNEKQLSLFLRYHTTHQRSFYQALKTLTALQKDRARAKHGFVSQTAVHTPDENGFVSQSDPTAALQQEFVRQNPASKPSRAGQQAA